MEEIEVIVQENITNIEVQIVPDIDEEIVVEISDNTIALNGDKHYIHNQSSPSASWSVVHNLNKFPSVMVVDSANDVIVGNIAYIDSNNLIISFTSSLSGKAYLN